MTNAMAYRRGYSVFQVPEGREAFIGRAQKHGSGQAWQLEPQAESSCLKRQAGSRECNRNGVKLLEHGILLPVVTFFLQKTHSPKSTQTGLGTRHPNARETVCVWDHRLLSHHILSNHAANAPSPPCRHLGLYLPSLLPRCLEQLWQKQALRKPWEHKGVDSCLVSDILYRASWLPARFE